MRPDSDGVYYHCWLKSNHFAEFWFWCEYQQDGERLFLNLTLPLSACLCLHLYLTYVLCLNTHVTEVTIIYLLSAWGRNDDHQHTHKHTCLPALAQWLTHQRLWCFFCIISSFHFNLFYVLVCLLPFSLIVSFCLSLF